jgi:AcrR family transcriptional regulator
MNDETTKTKIIETTIALMVETGDADRITMRSIADRTGVGLGAINYHFQTKDNLVRSAVRAFINRVIGKWTATTLCRPKASPAAKVRALLATSADFLAEHPRVSRISILFDLENPAPDDNTRRAVAELAPFVRDVLAGRNRNGRAIVIARALVAALQSAFLRSYALGDAEQPSFMNAKERNAMIEALIGAFLPSKVRGE